MKLLEFIAFRFFVACGRITPFWAVYLWADLFYFIVYYIIGYRKRVVVENLRKSFPQKTDDEIRLLSKKFYRHLADISLES
ncbi:MAG: lauroyl acyltransferase, partial [Bacteroidales bacterium]|nr:lauroyl acyltransferase [Bacteroidales bacterium]